MHLGSYICLKLTLAFRIIHVTPLQFAPACPRFSEFGAASGREEHAAKQVAKL